VFESGEPLVSGTLDTGLSGARRRAASRHGLRSGLAFAATGDDGPLAVLSFYTHDRRVTTERLLRTLTGIGRELGRFLSQRRAELGSRRLSERELEVLTLAAEGNTGPQIAEQLVVSPATIKTHFEHIYEKLGVGDRAAAVAHGLRTGLIR
jgi:DNA-binding NarL/FixJ family response regulator